MAERPYRSIGEVLSLLKDEFPDVTISKIRFLESQGLLDPERTASGYRKFYEPDVERLRWILRQQREHFLPLKVIKGRLGVGTAGGEDAADEVDVDLGDLADPTLQRHGRHGPDEHDTHPSGPRRAMAAAAPASSPVSSTAVETPPATRPAPAPAPAIPSPAPGPPAAATLPPPPAEPAPRVPAPAADRTPAPTALSPGMTGVSLTIEELANATGLPYERIRELERYGFFTGRPVAGTTYYDEEALVVANLAVGFARFGIEGRHLRIYKNSADREAGLFEQIVTPLLKQRNPEARRQAQQALEDLTQLGQSLRAAVLRQAVRRLSGG